MESLRRGQIMFQVHGPDTETDEVAAAVFARQLGILSRALRAADRAINGRHVHDYFIASLSTSTPTALRRCRIFGQRDKLKADRSKGA
jgi:hypothetical protein